MSKPTSPTSAKLIKDGAVIDNKWQTLANTDTPDSVVIPDGAVLVPLNVWQAQTDILSQRDNIGVWIANDITPAEYADNLKSQPVIAIEFPVFMDGRGFSIARLLRERFQYEGDIRAIGNVIRDQLCYLKRCGFSSFELSDDIDLTAALASLNDFTESYQTAADQPLPLFRRKA